VAAAGEIAGGEGSGDIRGGLYAQAGNGVLVYDPISNKYFTYFPCAIYPCGGHDRPGGGYPGTRRQYGTNARKRGHGGHLHLGKERRRGRALDCYELRTLLLSL
jgi:hypothetical protein